MAHNSSLVSELESVDLVYTSCISVRSWVFSVPGRNRKKQRDTETDKATLRGSRGQGHGEELQGQNGSIFARTATSSVQTHTHTHTHTRVMEQ